MACKDETGHFETNRMIGAEIATLGAENSSYPRIGWRRYHESSQLPELLIPEKAFDKYSLFPIDKIHALEKIIQLQPAQFKKRSR